MSSEGSTHIEESGSDVRQSSRVMRVGVASNITYCRYMAWVWSSGGAVECLGVLDKFEWWAWQVRCH